MFRRLLLVSSADISVILLMRSKGMDGFPSRETPLVLVRGQMDHRIPIHVAQVKATRSAYFVKEIQTQFFSLGKDEISRSLLPPAPAWMDRDRQTVLRMGCSLWWF